MTTDGQYTPSDEDVYGVWTNYQCFYADDGYGPRGTERAAAEMDRYIARVRRDAARGALDGLVDAWLGKYGTPETQDAGIAVRDYRETHYRLPEETP